MSSVIRLSVTILRLYFREPLTVFLSLGLLVLMMIMFGVMSTGDLSNLHLPIAVLDDTHGASPVANTLAHDTVLSTIPAANEAEVAELIRTAQAIGGVIIARPGSALTGGSSTGVQVVLSDSSQNHWAQVGLEHLRVVLSGSGAAAAAIPARYVHIEVVNNRFIDFIFPGVLALAILESSLGSATVMLSARKMGVLRRLQLTPLSSAQIFSGFLLGRCVIILIHIAVLTAVAMLVFHARIQTSIGVFLAEVLLGIVCFMSMAALVALLAPSFESGAIITQLLNFPMAFLCGVFFHNDNLPHAATYVVKLMPLSYFVDVMRGTIQAGMPLSRFPTQLAVLCTWSAVCVSCFLLFSRRRVSEQL